MKDRNSGGFLVEIVPLHALLYARALTVNVAIQKRGVPEEKIGRSANIFL